MMTKATKLYEQAVHDMEALYKKINSNIPDYDLFEIPIVKEWAEYPKESVSKGTVSQKGIKLRGSNFRIIKLKFENYAEMVPHTHYDYWEYMFITNGIFKDIKDNKYKSGDNILVDGYMPHTLKCMSPEGEVIVIFAKEKRFARFKYLRDYLK